jgi:hypothetical protein
VRLGEELIGVLGVDPDDQAPLRAGRHRHVAADKNDEAAEHAPLADIGLACYQPANPVGEILVVRHAQDHRQSTTSRSSVRLRHSTE